MIEEITKHCKEVILPYWKKLIDAEYGGFYGLVDFDLHVEKNADKGVILNSRILYFFARTLELYQEVELKRYADHAYQFLIDKCLDKENGGVYWMLSFDGSVKEDMKHTYNQAFAIYALSQYAKATESKEALSLAMDIFYLIETKCVDKNGYVEAFTKEWEKIDNEKLSENGLLAEKTMNTLLHLLEAYTLLYEVSRNEEVGRKLKQILDRFYTQVWNKQAGHLEVFFDCDMKSIANLYSYGHDIEASWLIDRAYEVLEIQVPDAYTTAMAEHVYQSAYKDKNVWNECFNGVIDKTKVWWVQAEAMVGFANVFAKTNDPKYIEATKDIWSYILLHFVDPRDNSEWFWDLDENDTPSSKKPLTEPWKCPYHNGRMCLELLERERRQ